MFKLRPDLLRKEQIPLGKEECLAGSEKLGILSASAKSVIPESADGGYPESRKNNTLLDTGSHPAKRGSSGMTIGAVSQTFSAAC